MNDRRDGSMIAPTAVKAAALALVFFVLIWALTGVGYFWPMWPVLGVSLVSGLVAALRWARRLPRHTDRWLAGQAAVSGVISVSQLAIWLMTGVGYFWPVWPWLGLAGLLGLHWIIDQPRQRSLEVRVDELTRTRSGALDVQASEPPRSG